MRYNTYETDIITINQGEAMTTWFDKEIGTEWDLTPQDFNKVSIAFFELTDEEVKKCRHFETVTIPLLT